MIILTMSPDEFLSCIWPRTLLRGETLELRAKNPITGKISRQFHSSRNTFLESSLKLSRTHNVYFGVSTRFEQGGKKRDCFRTGCVWLDFDGPVLPKFSDKPDIIVESGTGFHVYWLLTTSLFVRTGRWTEVEAVNRALAKKYHGDIAAIDVSRVLRVPGTLNHKHTPARLVSCHSA
jgi:hypothetical protein